MNDLYIKYINRCNNLKGLGAINEGVKDYSIFNTYDYFKDLMSREEFRKVLNFKSNRYKKRKRCFNNYTKIDMLSRLTGSQMVFGTITLDNIFLKLNDKNQKKIIERYLKKHYFYVLKNADYGDKTNRLHYHFIGLTFDTLLPNGKRSKKGRPMYNLKNDDWKFGFSPNLEIIPYNMIDKKRLSNYLVKLNNHSNKMSVRHTRLSILKNKNYLSKYCVFSDCIL